ncbi:AraC family transcriptional regulator [Tenacibaculum adriaticum]|uniref:AraC family transcriptional regulator n=1 Tax=Tenacibaculum adriaticum TaxID=413713 RepID=A0A5S5DRF0_9FLAO|nr:helix-turn-helix domain-containing protein [Tenacibaculum adriaticum]TYP98335.1 AraC family transcriptional regulator [Tenacibaculum adriaticum]
MKDLQVINTISEVHSVIKVTKSKHPLLSILKFEEIEFNQFADGMRARIDLYQIWMKEGVNCQLGYGRSIYDFTDGTLAFLKPGQVLTSLDAQNSTESKGFLILIHPDLIRKSPIGKSINQYAFFDYETTEALHVSDSEKITLTEIINNITIEINQNIDKHSQSLINSNLELFLGYCLRFYDRQFYTRTNHNQDVVTKLQSFLAEYYQTKKPLNDGIPTVASCATYLHMSPNYLSDLLRKEIGKNSQEFIRDFVVDKAKDLLLGTSEPLSQIAYAFGYEYPQHFTKVFKRKTGLSPSVYRQLN